MPCEEETYQVSAYSTDSYSTKISRGRNTLCSNQLVYTYKMRFQEGINLFPYSIRMTCDLTGSYHFLLSQVLTHTPTHSHMHSHTLTLTLTHMHSHSHTLTLTLTLTDMHSHTFTLTLILTHMHSHMLLYSPTPIHHTQTLTHSHTSNSTTLKTIPLPQLIEYSGLTDKETVTGVPLLYLTLPKGHW